MTRSRLLLLCAVFGLHAGTALAQSNQSDRLTPARSILRFRMELALTEGQTSRLEQLAASQSSSLSLATAAFLRAEAALLDATTTDDQAARRAALERRAKVAIDAEIARMKAEKESRAILTAEQKTRLIAAIGQSEAEGKTEPRSLWNTLVAPASLANSAVDLADSAEVRAIVMPNHAEIYIGGVKRGAGRMAITLPIGRHELRFHASGCEDVVVPITVVKGPPLFVPAQTLICRQNEPETGAHSYLQLKS